MTKFCDANAPPGCKPGCAEIETGKPSWCRAEDALNNAAEIYNCAWLPQDLNAMLLHHTANPWSYNEVVIDTATWVPRLPRTIDAVFFPKGGSAAQADYDHSAVLSPLQPSPLPSPSRALPSPSPALARR